MIAECLNSPNGCRRILPVCVVLFLVATTSTIILVYHVREPVVNREHKDGIEQNNAIEFLGLQKGLQNYSIALRRESSDNWHELSKSDAVELLKILGNSKELTYKLDKWNYPLMPPPLLRFQIRIKGNGHQLCAWIALGDSFVDVEVNKDLIRSFECPDCEALLLKVMAELGVVVHPEKPAVVEIWKRSGEIQLPEASNGAQQYQFGTNDQQLREHRVPGKERITLRTLGRDLPHANSFEVTDRFGRIIDLLWEN